ncbi:YceI family protein [Brevibacterium otitidis]|uniref:YceI family protein n=1 Tax=Brevibacterium otitidis TaxID=53364 RepID=A0ABV5X5F7_9MICO|nr:YceI family protein [Brevibacterium otitidis]
MTTLTPGTWNLDNAHSRVGFTVRHAGISKVRGVFTDVEGRLTAAETFADSRVEASAKAASFDSGDATRDAHVVGPDFFDSENHPNLSFVATGIEGDGADFKLTGDLTIKGTTRPVTFDVEFGGAAVDPFGATRAGFEATTKISRKEFGITWNAALETGGVLVSDTVTITVDAAFVLAAD